MMKFIKRSAFVLIAAYLVFAAALFAFQRRVLYIPPAVYLAPAGVGLSEATEVYSPEHPDSLLGWWLAPKENTSPIVMFFHGNGSAVFSSFEIYQRLHAEGFGVFAVAYPGYPGRSGTSTQESLTLAAQQGYDFVLAQGGQADRIAFYGTSLGSGLAAQLSTRRRPALIIMEAPFTSVADMAQMQFPFLPAALLSKDKFHSDKALAGSGIPMIWLHGTDDRVIPLSMGQSLFEGYDGPKTPHIIQNGQHSNLWYLGGDNIIIEAVSKLRD